MTHLTEELTAITTARALYVTYEMILVIIIIIIIIIAWSYKERNKINCRKDTGENRLRRIAEDHTHGYCSHPQESSVN